MIILDELKNIVEADPKVVGDDFHKRLLDRLRAAISQTGMDHEEIERLDIGFSEKWRLMEGSFFDTYEPQFKEMEEHLCLSSDYRIPSHRKGLAGAFSKFIKWLTLKIKLKSDVQVSQQAKFNLAALVSLQITSNHLDFLKEVAERMMEIMKAMDEKSVQKEEIDELKKEIAKLKERLDGR